MEQKCAESPTYQTGAMEEKEAGTYSSVGVRRVSHYTQTEK